VVRKESGQTGQLNAGSIGCSKEKEGEEKGCGGFKRGAEVGNVMVQKAQREGHAGSLPNRELGAVR